MASRERKDSEKPAAVAEAGALREISIEESTRDAIDAHVGSNTAVEMGGVLVGYVDEATGHVMVTASIPAHRATSAVASLTFTHEAWDDMNEIMSSDYEGMKMVGWYHSHPRFGIFLSEYDVFIQKNFFSETWQVAYVVDPVLGKSGIFGWEAGEIVRYPVWSVIARGASKSVREPDRGSPPTSGGPPLAVRLDSDGDGNDRKKRQIALGGGALIVALAAGFGIGDVVAGSSPKPTPLHRHSSIAPTRTTDPSLPQMSTPIAIGGKAPSGLDEQWAWLPSPGVYAVTISLAGSAKSSPLVGTVNNCVPVAMSPVYAKGSAGPLTSNCRLALSGSVPSTGLSAGRYETFLFVPVDGPTASPKSFTPEPSYAFNNNNVANGSESVYPVDIPLTSQSTAGTTTTGSPTTTTTQKSSAPGK